MLKSKSKADKTEKVLAAEKEQFGKQQVGPFPFHLRFDKDVYPEAHVSRLLYVVGLHCFSLLNRPI
jgi:uncharacterized lipoprotein YbaY